MLTLLLVWSQLSPANPSLEMTPTTEHNLLRQQIKFCSRCNIQRRLCSSKYTMLKVVPPIYDIVLLIWFYLHDQLQKWYKKPQNQVFVMEWPWPLTYDLDLVGRPRHYPGTSSYQILWPYVQWFGLRSTESTQCWGIQCWGTETKKQRKKERNKQINLVKLKRPCFALA